MKKLEEIIEGLEKYIGKDHVEKRGLDKYFINSNLTLINEMELLPIYLVSIDDEIYFADYGNTFESLNIDYEKLDNAKKKIIQNIVNKYDVELEEGNLLLKADQEMIYLSYNIFVMCILAIEAIVN